MSILAESVCAAPELIETIQTALRDRIGPQKYNAWFKHGTNLTIEGEGVKVWVPNPFVANWIESHYRREITETIRQCTGSSPKVMVMIDPSLSEQFRRGQLDMQAEIVAKTTSGRARGSQRTAHRPKLRYRLEDFVVGKSNRLAYSAAKSLVAREVQGFSPVFVYGSCGVGKTHLLQGLCAAVARRDGRTGSVAWRYVTGEQFTNEYIAAVRKRDYTSFRCRYRNLEILAVDDVHFLSAKKATQEEFLHTFNAIHTAGHQIIMASDTHPRLLGDLIEQLVSRFVSGVVVRMDPPDKAMRLEILRLRAKQRKLPVGQEVLEYLAAHVKGSVRELEGALVKLAAAASVNGGRIDLELVREALADHLARTDSAVTLGDIESVVTAYFGITPADLHSSRRTRTVSVARMVAMFFARRHTRMSFPEIGRFMGKNHSSVVLAVKKMDSLLRDGRNLTWMTPTGPKTMSASRLAQLLQEQFA